MSTRAGTSFKISGGKNEVHLIGYFEPEADTDSDEGFSECLHEDEDTDEEISSMEGEDAKDSSDENDEQSTEENGEGSSSDDDDDDDDDQEDEDELMDSGDDVDDDEEFDDDEDEEEEKELEKKKVLPATTKKIDDKAGKKAAKAEKPVPATTESKKRKVETPVQKPQKIQKTESSSNNSAEAEFEKAVADYLKKNGRCMIAQLAGKVRKPDALKAVKYQAFLKVSITPVFSNESVASTRAVLAVFRANPPASSLKANTCR